jgi:hypothetical protein
MAKIDPAVMDSAIERALGCVTRGQLASGLFPTLASPEPDLAGAGPVDSVYISTYIVHVLAQARPDPARANAMRSAARAIVEHGEPGGLWRFFGRQSANLPPDFDDTCCALAALRQCDVPTDSSVAGLLEKCALPGGGYGRWIDRRLNHPRGFDGGVNANILFYLALAGRPTESPARHLAEFAQQRRLSGLSGSALSDPPVLYMLMRAFRHGPVPGLARLAPRVAESLLARQRADGGFGHELDTALSVTALIDAGHRGANLDATARWLLARQLPHGGWPARTLFCDFLPTYYGSEELTTAICAEALTKIAAAARARS